MEAQRDQLLTPAEVAKLSPGGPEDGCPLGQRRKAFLDPDFGWSPPLPQGRDRQSSQSGSVVTGG
jgi:hypothetical protein